MYQLQIERRAERDLKRLKKHSASTFFRILSRIAALKNNPRPEGVRKLVGSESDWRISIGDYRVIYEIDDRQRVVRIYRVRHRREVYRQ